MFERYTEPARRTIFFARYEACQFGSPYIEAEHLLLGILREDKALANPFLPSHATVASIRKQIEGHTTRGEKVSITVDLPLSYEYQRVLAHASEEAERFDHKQIGTAHLMVGLLREEQCFAARMLRERGLTLDTVREQVRQLEPQFADGKSAALARLVHWLADREARGGVWTAKLAPVGNRTAQFAVYEGDPTKQSEKGQDLGPAEKLAQLQNRIDFILARMERAIANHEFEKARFYSDEERKEREKLRLLREQFQLEEPPSRVPVLCIEVIRKQRFSEVQKLSEDYILAGVSQVWLLDPDLKRAYTFTKAEGLREFRGGILQIAIPPLEMDLSSIFD
jgi:hypothetical protein